jgi:hypothetical protein
MGSMTDADDVSGSIFADDNPTSTARTTPAAFEPDPLMERSLCPQVIDASQNWEVRNIIGKEDVDGVLHYLVEWSPTLEPVHLLGHAKELVDEFEARLRTQHGVKNGRGLSALKIRQKAIGQGSQQQKRPRGRPPKANVRLGYQQPSRSD